MQQFNRLEFTEFPRTWGIITIPENYVVYRGGTTPPFLKSDPRFFSDFQTANMYTQIQPGYKTYACCVNELKLMDIRTLRYLFLEYVGYNRLMFSDEELGLIKKILFALGLIPLKEQLQYIQTGADIHTGLQHWKNKFPDENNISDLEYEIRCDYEAKTGGGPIPMNIDENIEYYMNFGNRISECSIDDYMVGLLKIIFQDTIDGYIAPRLETVWHDFNFHPELCLFNPSKSLKLCSEVPTSIPNPDAFITPIHIYTLLGTKKIADYNVVIGGGNSNGSKCKIRKDKNTIQSEQFKEIDQNFTNVTDTTKITSEIAEKWHAIKSSPEPDKTVPIVSSDIFFNKVPNSQAKKIPNSQVKRTQVQRQTVQNTRNGIQDEVDPELF